MELSRYKLFRSRFFLAVVFAVAVLASYHEPERETKLARVLEKLLEERHEAQVGDFNAQAYARNMLNQWLDEARLEGQAKGHQQGYQEGIERGVEHCEYCSSSMSSRQLWCFDKEIDTRNGGLFHHQKNAGICTPKRSCLSR